MNTHTYIPKSTYKPQYVRQELIMIDGITYLMENNAEELC